MHAQRVFLKKPKPNRHIEHPGECILAAHRNDSADRGRYRSIYHRPSLERLSSTFSLTHFLRPRQMPSRNSDSDYGVIDGIAVAAGFGNGVALLAVASGSGDSDMVAVVWGNDTGDVVAGLED